MAAAQETRASTTSSRTGTGRRTPRVPHRRATPRDDPERAGRQVLEVRAQPQRALARLRALPADPRRHQHHGVRRRPARSSRRGRRTDPRTAFRALHLSHLRVDVSDTGLRLQAVCDDSSSKDDTTCAQGSVLDEYTIGTPPSSPPKTEFYVDKTVPGCSDLGPGTAAQPFCTLTKGVGRMQPGYTLYVGDGIYGETIKPTVSGTATSPITITAWPGRSPTIGSGVTNGAYLSAKSYIVLSEPDLHRHARRRHLRHQERPHHGERQPGHRRRADRSRARRRRGSACARATPRSSRGTPAATTTATAST